MGTIIRVGVVAAVVAVAAACGGSADDGGSERVLHMRGYDIPESAFRFYVQDSLKGIDGFCDDLQDPDAQHIIALMTDGAGPGGVVGPADIIDGGTPVPGQTAAPETRTTVADIIKQECER